MSFFIMNLLKTDQACQAGGSVAISMQPAITFYISYMTGNYYKLYEFTVISIA